MNEQEIKELDKESKKILLVFLSFIVITIMIFGLSYAFFTYQKDGTKLVTMTSGSVKLHYGETNLKQVSLLNALPMSDEMGKAQTNYFEFTITSETAGYDIPYYVASRVTTLDANQIPSSYISVYLTEVVNGVENQEPILNTTYDNLTSISKNNHVEEQLMLNTVPANTSNYLKVYRLRMWINNTADYSPIEESGVQTYPMEGKSFEFIVNVYTEAEAYTASCQTPNIGDTYCFDTQCFDVVSSDCNETVLLALYNLDAFGDPTYSEPTGIQISGAENPTTFFTHFDYPLSNDEYGAYWAENVGEGKKYAGDFDENTETPYPYIIDSDIMNGTLVPVVDHYTAYTCDYQSYGCIPYVLNQYLTKLKQPAYNVPQSTQIRLLTKEDADILAANNYCSRNDRDFWFLTGSAASTDSVFMFTCNDANNYVVPSGYGEIDYDDISGIRPVLVIPTNDLPQSAKYEYSISNKIINYYAEQIANELNLDYDEFDLDYNEIDGLKSNNRPNDKRITFYLNNNTVPTEEEQQITFKKVFNYLKTNISDDGKLYEAPVISDLVEIDINSLSDAYRAGIIIDNKIYDVVLAYSSSSIRMRDYYTFVVIIEYYGMN